MNADQHTVYTRLPEWLIDVISFLCFPSAQQTLREKWVELQSLTLQEKRLTRGEKKKKKTIYSCSDS